MVRARGQRAEWLRGNKAATSSACRLADARGSIPSKVTGRRCRRSCDSEGALSSTVLVHQGLLRSAALQQPAVPQADVMQMCYTHPDLATMMLKTPGDQACPLNLQPHNQHDLAVQKHVATCMMQAFGLVCAHPQLFVLVCVVQRMLKFHLSIFWYSNAQFPACCRERG